MPVFTSPWATRRQIIYFLGVVFGVAIVVAIPAILILYRPANCFDGKKNGGEVGVDCGGSCSLLCKQQVSEPVVHWARSFKIREGEYSAMAYVENQNINGGTYSIKYKFEFYDTSNQLIESREGQVYIPPQSIIPVFEGRINLSEKPARTLFTFLEGADWIKMSSRRGDMMVRNQILQDIDTQPRLIADIENTSIHTFNDVQAVAIVYDVRGNAAAISRTSLDKIKKDEQYQMVFTWPQPFPTRVERCAVPADVSLLMDTSGSMNDDSLHPPQPLTDAKNAAAAFIDRMSTSDRVSVVSFATNSSLTRTLTKDLDDARRSLLSLTILPEEESGFTNIGEAIKTATGDLLNARINDSGENSGRESAVVLLTDGRANQPENPGGEEYALVQGREARSQDIDIYAIGLGESVNLEFLREIASDDSAVYRALDSQELDGIYQQISESLCQKGPAIIDVIPLSKDLMVPIE